MLGYVYNDGGREAAGRKGQTRDCVVRALAIVTERPYLECYRALAEANSKSRDPRSRGKRSASNGVSKDAYVKVYAEFGLEKVKLPAGGRPTYTEAFETYGDCVVTTAGHVAALKDGALQDLFDGRTYVLLDGLGQSRRYPRKAQSVWVRKEV